MRTMNTVEWVCVDALLAKMERREPLTVVEYFRADYERDVKNRTLFREQLADLIEPLFGLLAVSRAYFEDPTTDPGILKHNIEMIDATAAKFGAKLVNKQGGKPT